MSYEDLRPTGKDVELTIDKVTKDNTVSIIPYYSELDTQFVYVDILASLEPRENWVSLSRSGGLEATFFKLKLVGQEDLLEFKDVVRYPSISSESNSIIQSHDRNMRFLNKCVKNP